MSTFEDQGYQWRETYFVLFSAGQRPSLKKIAAALHALNPRFQLTNESADEEGRFESLTLQSPDDYAALDVSYVEGEEVREQLELLIPDLKAGGLDKEEKAKLVELSRCDARFDVLHFAQRIGETEDEADEVLDPGALLIALDTLIDLTHGIGVDPQSGTMMEMAKAAATIAALDYLAAPHKHEPRPVCVLFGAEAFLKREALTALRKTVSSGDDDFSFSDFDADRVEWSTVIDALSTASLFGGGRRVVLLSEADKFVSEHRARLEDYVAKPHETGVLILTVDLWPSNTRLYKAVAEHGLPIDCQPPKPAGIVKWMLGRAKEPHQATLSRDGAELLLELVGPEIGLLEQELGKLSLLARPAKGDGPANITADLVRENVGSWRAQRVWDLVDAAMEGRAAEAIRQLDRLIRAGEPPLAILGQISSSLRRFTSVARIVEASEAQGRRMPLRNALIEAGTPPYFVEKAERQTIQLGRARAGKLLRWVLEADQAMKGTSSSPQRSRLVMEQLLCRLSTQLSDKAKRS